MYSTLYGSTYPSNILKIKKNRGLLRVLPYMGTRWQCLGWIGQAVTVLPLRFSDPEGVIVLSRVNGQDLTRCHYYSYAR